MFLGEERADFNACCAAYHLNQWSLAQIGSAVLHIHVREA